MFEKLLALLPYNPGLLHQMSFYSRRMREEASIRRTGLIFIVLAFMIQFFAVLSPPQPTVADSVNDLINSGFSSAAEAADHCLHPTKYTTTDAVGSPGHYEHYGSIIHYFGLTCKDIANAQTVTISKDESIVKPSGQREYVYSMGEINYTYTNDTLYTNIPFHDKVYARRLSQVAASPSFKALKLKNSEGRTYFILYDCGNIAAFGLPTPPPVKHPTVIQEETEEPTTPTVQPCQFNNAIAADSPDCYEHCTVAGKTTLHRNDPLCFEPCTYNSAIASNNPNCSPPCPYNSSILTNNPDCYEHCPVAGKTSLHKNDFQCYTPCEYNASLAASDKACKPCDKSVSSADTLACIEIHKTASNVTAGIADANNTTAKGGDIITYTLYAKNNGKATIEKFTFNENLSDVLDYADVTDLHGGSMDGSKNVTWPAQEVKADETATKQITVTVKNPVPQTPVSSSDGAHFDMIMTNVYGNVVNIKLPPSVNKSVEIAAAKLPNTGPGTTLFVGALIVIVGGYFYGRARLLAKESELCLKH